MSERKIKWNLHSYNFENKSGTFKQKSSSYEELEEQEYTQEGGMQINDVIMDTPFGLFIRDDDLNPYKQFEFWVGHTNFDITRSVADTIMTCPGVEVFELLSRYRFIIGVGQLFAFQDVRASLQQTLCGTLVDVKNITTRINALKQDFVDGEYADWALYVFPNGEIDFCYLEKDHKNIEEFKAKKQLLQDSQLLSKGQLFLHEPDREPSSQEE